MNTAGSSKIYFIVHKVVILKLETLPEFQYEFSMGPNVTCLRFLKGN